MIKKLGWLCLVLSICFAAQGQIQTIPLGEPGTNWENLEAGVQGGTFYMASISNPKSFNATIAKETSTTLITGHVMAGLVDEDPFTGEVMPGLAESWEMSEDGLTIVFHLRKGLKWSDGYPFTAEDIVWTFNEVIYNPDVETSSRDVLELPDGTLPVVEKIDKFTVKVTLSTIFRPVLKMLGVSIMPKHMLHEAIEEGTFNEAWGVGTDPADIVGLGPYIIDSYTADQQVVMKRNPYYWRFDSNRIRLPYYDKRVILCVSDQDVGLLKFQNGDIDAWSLRAQDVSVLKERPGDFVVHLGGATAGTLWVAFNQDIGLTDQVQTEMRTLFRDVRFRKAMAHAVDKQRIIDELYYGLAIPQWSLASFMSPFYAGRDFYAGPITENNAITYEYNLDKARELLAEIGLKDLNGDGWLQYEDGSRVEIELNTNTGNTNREAFCVIYQKDLEEIGIKLNYVPQQFNALVNRLLSATYEAVVLGLTGGDEPHGGVNVYGTTGSLHAWHFSAQTDSYTYEKRIDNLYDAGVNTWDNDEAFESYKEIQTLFATEDLGLVFTVNQRLCYAYYDYVGNAKIIHWDRASATGGFGWELVFDERLVPESKPEFIPIRIMPTVSIPDFEALVLQVNILTEVVDGLIEINKEMLEDIDHLSEKGGDTGSAAWIGWLALLVASIAVAITVIRKK